jgi:FtsP/CotA-like multicopper oxidase with cupredoxin domain
MEATRFLRMGPVLIAAAGLLNLSACGSAAAPPGPASGSTVLLGQADAGRTIQVKVGDTVRITLEDEYPVPGSSVVWNVTSSNEAVLALGAVLRSTAVPSGPGKHDTYTADFSARAAGQAVLDAHGTTTCEAMAKQNCPDRDFKITVIVTG